KRISILLSGGTLLFQDKAITSPRGDRPQPGAEAPRGVIAKLAHGAQQLFENNLGDIFGVGLLQTAFTAPGPDTRLITLHELVPGVVVAGLLRKTQEERVRRIPIG